MAGQSQGANAQLAIDGDKYCFTKFEDKSIFKMVDGSEEAICGRLDRHKDRVTEGIIIPRFTLTMQPTPEEIDRILPWIGYSETSDVFTPITDFSSNGLDVEYSPVASLITYTGAMIDKAIWRGRKNGPPIELELECMATNIDIDDGGTFSASTFTKTSPYAFNEANLSLGGSSELYQSLVLVEDHKLYMQHNNSVTPTSLRPQDRQFFLGLDTPYTSDEVTLISAFTGETTAATSPDITGFAGSFIASRGNFSLTGAMHNLKQEARLPSTLGKVEIRAKHWFQIYGNSSTAPLIWTNDITA